MSGTSTGKPIRQDFEKFFIATDELEDKKLEIIGWKGPKIAMKAIKDSAKTFRRTASNSAQHQPWIIRRRAYANPPPLSRDGRAAARGPQSLRA